MPKVKAITTVKITPTPTGNRLQASYRQPRTPHVSSNILKCSHKDKQPKAVERLRACEEGTLHQGHMVSTLPSSLASSVPLAL
ncbi:Hypothetical predicted protein [Marmota monax]|uniref:Uncharacterized protein n=1 Tax=Marmota monax TaxID=9995 RepID=A0A5E4CC14_MARMO|nr:hypothetical protein GHT09_002007 [Marmota monax]VTJ79246.1 Hypothetical predicted protein [Marmota monax]